MSTPLMEAESLSLRFQTPSGLVNVLDNVSFTLHTGETLGLVGESGSGKSVTALALAGLLDARAQMRARRLRFQGRDLLDGQGAPNAAAWQGLRGRRIGFVFQSPRRALHPLRTVGDQLQQVLRVHRGLTAGAARLEALAWIERVGLSEPGLNRVINAAYSLLGLQTYFTAGVKEVRAWTVRKGATAPQAAAVIHTDFEKGYIRAETIAYDDFIKYKGEAGAKEAGRLRLEGKEYRVQEGDVLHFRFNV